MSCGIVILSLYGLCSQIWIVIRQQCFRDRYICQRSQQIKWSKISRFRGLTMRLIIPVWYKNQLEIVRITSMGNEVQSTQVRQHHLNSEWIPYYLLYTLSLMQLMNKEVHYRIIDAHKTTGLGTNYWPSSPTSHMNLVKVLYITSVRENSNRAFYSLVKISEFLESFQTDSLWDQRVSVLKKVDWW